MATGNTRTNVLITLGVLFTIGGASRILPHAFAAAENTVPAEHDEGAPGAGDLISTSYDLDSFGEDTPGRVCFMYSAPRTR